MYSLLLCCWKRMFAVNSAFSQQNSISFCPASFCTPRPNSRCFLTSYFCIPVPCNEKDIFCGVSSKRSCMFSNFNFFSVTGWGIGLDYCDIEWFALETNKDHSVVFETASKYCISGSFVDHDGYSASTKGFLPAVVYIMVI